MLFKTVYYTCTCRRFAKQEHKTAHLPQKILLKPDVDRVLLTISKPVRGTLCRCCGQLCLPVGMSVTFMLEPHKSGLQFTKATNTVYLHFVKTLDLCFQSAELSHVNSPSVFDLNYKCNGRKSLSSFEVPHLDSITITFTNMYTNVLLSLHSTMRHTLSCTVFFLFLSVLTNSRCFKLSHLNIAGESFCHPEHIYDFQW